MIESAPTTKQSILLSEVLDIQIGSELSDMIKALTKNNLVWVQI